MRRLSTAQYDYCQKSIHTTFNPRNVKQDQRIQDLHENRYQREMLQDQNKKIKKMENGLKIQAKTLRIIYNAF
jgi:hypothetical protein